MNFKPAPTICPYYGSYLTKKDGKVAGVKPWTIHPAGDQHHKDDLVHDHNSNLAPISLQDQAAFFIANDLIRRFQAAAGCAT